MTVTLVCGRCSRRLGRARRVDGRLRLDATGASDGLWLRWGVRDECNHCRAVLDVDFAAIRTAVDRHQRVVVVPAIRAVQR